MREDIIAGLKNAYERGESMQKAMQAFINAGYNKEEVEEAARFLNFSYSQQEQPASAPAQQTQQKMQFQPLPKSPSLTEEIPVPNAPSPPQTQAITPSSLPAISNPEKPKSTRKLRFINIGLGIIVFILLVIIGISAWNFLKGQWIL